VKSRVALAPNGCLEGSSEQNWDRANHRLQPKGVWGEESIAPKGATKFTGPFSGRMSFSGPLAGFSRILGSVEFGQEPGQ